MGFRISPRFYPIRLNAYMRNEVELSIELENNGAESYWTECDVILPEALSLARDRELRTGRIRVGIINSKEILTGKCKIYADATSYPELYSIKIIAYGFGKDGSISQREEKKAELRCERIGKD